MGHSTACVIPAELSWGRFAPEDESVGELGSKTQSSTRSEDDDEEDIFSRTIKNFQLFKNKNSQMVKSSQLIVPTVLFLILAPGMLFSIPAGPDQKIFHVPGTASPPTMMQWLVHSAIFFLVWFLLNALFKNTYCDDDTDTKPKSVQVQVKKMQ